MDLFAQAAEREAAARGPLADRMRPTSLASCRSRMSTAIRDGLGAELR